MRRVPRGVDIIRDFVVQSAHPVNGGAKQLAEGEDSTTSGLDAWVDCVSPFTGPFYGPQRTEGEKSCREDKRERERRAT